MLVHAFLQNAAERFPERVAIIEPGAQAGFGEINRRANQAASVLIGAGVRRGDRVVLALEDGIEWVATYFGILKAGAVAVPLPSGPQNDRLGRTLADCAPAAAIVSASTARDPAARAALATCPATFVANRAGSSGVGEAFLDWSAAVETGDEAEPPVRVIDLDLAAIIYTSGSTGEPRGAMLSHLNVCSNTASIVEYLALTAADRVMCVLPFYYVYGLSLLHTHVSVGGSVIVDIRFAYPNVVLQAMHDHRATGFAGVPSTFSLLLQRSNLAEMEFPDLRYVTQAGGGMPPARIREWLEKGPKAQFFVMYGATEASARLTYLHPSDLGRKLGSIGRPIPNVEILVMTEEGRVAAEGEVGELVARGSNISGGYWNNPEETALRFGPLGYRTGDLGYADAEGFLFLVGRKHDIIKVGARRVGAKEIEDVLNEHPAVSEAAVVGAPHLILGEAPVAFVASRDGVPVATIELQAFCRARLPAYKVPVEFIAVASLPKNNVGKIDKLALSRSAAERAGQDAGMAVSR